MGEKKNVKQYITIYESDLNTLNKNNLKTDLALTVGYIRSYEKKNMSCYVSQQKLADMFGKSLRTINQDVKNLKEIKLINVKRRSNLTKKIYKTNEYTTNNKLATKKSKKFRVPKSLLNKGLSAYEILVATLMINRVSCKKIKDLLSKTTYYRIVKKLMDNKVIKELIFKELSKLHKIVKRYIMKLIKNTIEAEESNRTVKCGNYNGSIEFLQDCYV